MTYTGAISSISIAALLAALVTFFIQSLITVDFRRKHHDVGSVIFLQLGVVFAVLLAFVFDEAWGEYNQAASAINLEVGAMHGAAMIAATLPPPQNKTILTDERAYLDDVAFHEWPVMATHRADDPYTGLALQKLLQDAANLRLQNPEDVDKKRQIMSLLTEAHAQRETRIFQANSGIPKPLWIVLIAFTVALALFVAMSGIQYRATAILITACFTGAVVSILVLARLLDFPFEGALALRPDDFVEALGKVSRLLQSAQ